MRFGAGKINDNVHGMVLKKRGRNFIHRINQNVVNFISQKTRGILMIIFMRFSYNLFKVKQAVFEKLIRHYSACLAESEETYLGYFLIIASIFHCKEYKKAMLACQPLFRREAPYICL